MNSEQQPADWVATPQQPAEANQPIAMVDFTAKPQTVTMNLLALHQLIEGLQEAAKSNNQYVIWDPLWILSKNEKLIFEVDPGLGKKNYAIQQKQSWGESVTMWLINILIIYFLLAGIVGGVYGIWWLISLLF